MTRENILNQMQTKFYITDQKKRKKDKQREDGYSEITLSEKDDTDLQESETLEQQNQKK